MPRISKKPVDHGPATHNDDQNQLQRSSAFIIPARFRPPTSRSSHKRRHHLGAKAAHRRHVLHMLHVPETRLAKQVFHTRLA